MPANYTELHEQWPARLERKVESRFGSASKGSGARHVSSRPRFFRFAGRLGGSGARVRLPFGRDRQIKSWADMPLGRRPNPVARPQFRTSRAPGRPSRPARAHRSLRTARPSSVLPTRAPPTAGQPPAARRERGAGDGHRPVPLSSRCRPRHTRSRAGVTSVVGARSARHLPIGGLRDQFLLLRLDYRNWSRR